MNDLPLLVVLLWVAVALALLAIGGLLWKTWRATKRLREEAVAGGFHRHVETGGGSAGSVRASYPLMALGVDARALHVVWMGRARAIARPDLRSITVWRGPVISAVRLEHAAPEISSPVVFKSWDIEYLLAHLHYHGWEFRR